MQQKSILSKLKHAKVKTKHDTIDIYRLGEFIGEMFELVELQANQYYPPHKHIKSSAKFYFILGKGTIILGNKKFKYKPGNYFVVKKKLSHGFKANTRTLFLSVQKPAIINKVGDIDYQYN